MNEHGMLILLKNILEMFSPGLSIYVVSQLYEGFVVDCDINETNISLFSLSRQDFPL